MRKWSGILFVAIMNVPLLTLGQNSTANNHNQAAVAATGAARSSSVVKVSRTIGVCSLIGNSELPNSAANTIMPILSVNSYFASLENRDVGYDGKMALVQPPKHGTLVEVGEGAYSYRSTDGFVGYDSATFMVEIGSYKVKTIYTFHVMNGVPGGTDGYDPYDDPKYCPKGEMWKISLNQNNVNPSAVAFGLPDALSHQLLKNANVSQVG